MKGLLFFIFFQVISFEFLFGRTQKDDDSQQLKLISKSEDFVKSENEKIYLELIERYYQGFFRIKENNYSSVYASLKKTFKEKGSSYYSLAKFDHAEKYLLWCLELEEFNPNKNDASLAESLKFLGFLYYDLSDYDQSEKYLLRSLEIYKLSFDQHHAEVSLILINLLLVYNELGSIYLQLKYWDEFLETLKLSFKIEKYTWSYLGALIPYVKNYKHLSKFIKIIHKKLNRSLRFITEAYRALNLKKNLYNAVKNLIVEVFSDSIQLLLR